MSVEDTEQLRAKRSRSTFEEKDSNKRRKSLDGAAVELSTTAPAIAVEIPVEAQLVRQAATLTLVAIVYSKAVHSSRDG